MYLDKPINENHIHPALSILYLLILGVIFLILGQFIGVGFLKIAFNLSFEDIKSLSSHPEDFDKSRMALLCMHAIGTILIGFIGTAYCWKVFIEKKTFSNLFININSNFWILAAVCIIITLASNPINSIFISINKQMVFPAGFEAFEQSLKANEIQLEKLTKFLVDFQNPLELATAILVMGIFTGIGEELIFRGALQNKLTDLFKNYHVAIWLAAFIFSMVHNQFYGLLPRMLLAALFGYMYVWSGNLWIPIIAHASNNTITVLAMYFSKGNEEAQNLVESNEIMPLPIIITSTLIMSGLLVYFYRSTRNIIPDESYQ